MGVRCHCCGQIATDGRGRNKSVPICWDCIMHGGSIERKCGQRHPRRDRKPRKPRETRVPAYVMRGIVDILMDGG